MPAVPRPHATALRRCCRSMKILRQCRVFSRQRQKARPPSPSKRREILLVRRLSRPEAIRLVAEHRHRHRHRCRHRTGRTSPVRRLLGWARLWTRRKLSGFGAGPGGHDTARHGTNKARPVPVMFQEGYTVVVVVVAAVGVGGGYDCYLGMLL